ncbi:MAG: sensor histidine kinase [Acidimicrobiales bacterium]
MVTLGIRTRLTVALVAVALFAVALAALIGNLGLTPRLNQAARERLDASSIHLSHIATDAYLNAGGWTTDVRNELGHAGDLVDLRVMLKLRDGRVLLIGPRPFGSTVEAPIVVKGVDIATIIVSAPTGKLLSAADVRLAGSLNGLHLVAAAIATLTALATALLLSQTLSRPLRRIRAVAERLSHGELDARVIEGAEPEIRDVGHALNQLAETLQQEERLRREGVADLAHELRTPVNGLLSRIEAAQDDVLPLEQNLSAMHREVMRLTQLLNDLSRLADAQQPGIIVNKSLLDLATLVTSVIPSVQPRIDERHIELNVLTEPTWVYGDTARLEQVIVNLLTNAVNYTAERGRIDVTVTHTNAEAVLEVRDNGIGMAAEDLPFIFTRFWRADRSRSRATGGTGIGLTIVNELVHAHNGRIDVDSALGVGSRFRVFLPNVDA